jgi:hypothetical protein
MRKGSNSLSEFEVFWLKILLRAAAQGLTIEAWVKLEDMFKRSDWLFGYSVHSPEDNKYFSQV